MTIPPLTVCQNNGWGTRFHHIIEATTTGRGFRRRGRLAMGIIGMGWSEAISVIMRKRESEIVAMIMEEVILSLVMSTLT